MGGDGSLPARGRGTRWGVGEVGGAPFGGAAQIECVQAFRAFGQHFYFF